MLQEQQRLYDKVDEALARREKFDVGTDDYLDADLDLQMAQDDLDYYNKTECQQMGEHMRMTCIDARKGDVCFNCGTI